MSAVDQPTITVRALTRDDLMQVVAIDAAIEGRSRRRYIERRLAAALRDPGQHAQFAAVDADGLAGYMLARVLEGEFGRSERALRLELLGVGPDARHRGTAGRLFDALLGWAARHGVTELRTGAAWNDHRVLGWLDAMGFSLAPAQVLALSIEGGVFHPEREDALSLEPGHGPGGEIDFGTSEANDFERLGRERAHVRSMTRADVSEIARIDRGITGRDRGDYIASRLAEAIDDAGVRVSLAAHMHGAVVGYLMARADLGDFGRAEPVAVIDTLGVEPEYAERGVGRALATQLFANLAALRVERVETVVGATDLELLGFFTSLGFTPSQRLAFVRRITEAGR